MDDPLDDPAFVQRIVLACGDDLAFVGRHGGVVDTPDRQAADRDVIVIVREVREAQVRMMRALREEFAVPEINFLLLTSEELAAWPPENRLQFIHSCQGIWGSMVEVAQPSPADLLRYLHAHLFDRVIIRVRNFWLHQYHYYRPEAEVLIQRICKEIFWWYRVYLVLRTGEYIQGGQRLLDALEALGELEGDVHEVLRWHVAPSSKRGGDAEEAFATLNRVCREMLSCYSRAAVAVGSSDRVRA